MRASRGQNSPARLESAIQAHVVPSRYALELQKRNQRSRAKVSELDSTFGQSHLPSGTIVWTQHAPLTAQSGVRNRWQTQPEHSDMFRGRARMAKSKAALNLHSNPRPTFPIRISTAGVKEGVKYLECGVMSSTWSERDDRVLVRTAVHVPSQINEGSEAGLLQCLSCQLRVVGANAEDILRRQEQHSQGEMMVAWEMLLSKLDQVQETSLRIDLQHHTKQVENYASKSSAQVLEKLRNISKLRTPLEIALNRLSCPGLTCSPLQLKQDMEALTLELDQLLELIDSSVHVSPVVSFDPPFGQTLLQTARLVRELGVEFKARMAIVNDNI